MKYSYALTFEKAKAEEFQFATTTREESTRIYLVTDGIRSSYTKRGYNSAFNDFLRTIVKNQGPEALMALLDLKPSVIESKIISYIEKLKERKISTSTIRMYCAAIFHFFEINDVHLNTRKIKRFFPLDESERYSTDRPYSVDEIRQILNKCDIRSKVIIYLMASTGMRIGALQMDKEGQPGIRYGDLKKIKEFGLYLIQVYSCSKSDRYYTFCTPECAEAIDTYLEYRRKFGEELKDKSPLIREQFNIDNPFTVKAPRFLSRRMMTHIFEDLLKRSGVNPLPPGQKRRDVMTSHGLRKFFITECDKANINFTVREFLAGHKLPNQDPHYIRRTEEDMLAEYVKVIPLLTIDQSKKLEKENQELKTERDDEIARLKWREGQQAQDISSLKERLNSTEESLNKIREIADDYTDLFVKSGKGYRTLISNLRSRLQKEGKWTDSLENEFWGVPDGVSY